VINDIKSMYFNDSTDGIVMYIDFIVVEDIKSKKEKELFTIYRSTKQKVHTTVNGNGLISRLRNK